MISVITPVYNAEKFIEKTIKSVLIQKEVSELILIDDGSSDASLDICLSFQERDDRIKVITHPDHKNHGRSATRNLGIKTAMNQYIAFLDADDFYLQNRFSNDVSVLENTPEIDGIYNAIGVHYYDEYKGERNLPHLTTVSSQIAPEELFEKMGPIGSMGYFSCDGLTVRKSAFEKVGLFNTELTVAEDTELWLKMALRLRIVGGKLDEAVTMRGVHGKNSFNDETLYRNNIMLMYSEVLEFGLKHGITMRRIFLLWKSRLFYLKKNSITNSFFKGSWQFGKMLFNPNNSFLLRIIKHIINQ